MGRPLPATRVIKTNRWANSFHPAYSRDPLISTAADAPASFAVPPTNTLSYRIIFCSSILPTASPLHAPKKLFLLKVSFWVGARE